MALERALRGPAVGLLLAAALLAGCVSGRDIDDLKAQLSDVQREIQQLQSQTPNKQEIEDLNRSISNQTEALLKSEADVQVGLQSLSTQIENLEAKLEETNYRLGQLSQQIAATNQELKSFRLQAPAETPAAAGTPPPPPGRAPSDPQAAYQAAYNDYLRGSYDLAILGFQQYLQAFPNTDLADNASYWIGECYFSQRKFQQAIREFDTILSRYPKSDKTASALLKKGYAYLELGDRGQGISLLQQVARQYPGSDEANLARQRLEALGVDAR